MKRDDCNIYNKENNLDIPKKSTFHIDKQHNKKTDVSHFLILVTCNLKK